MKTGRFFWFILLLGALFFCFGAGARAAEAAPSATPPAAPGTPVPAPKGTPSPTAALPLYARGDLHIHTICSDGENTYDVMAERALRLHYAYIAITDHGYYQNKVCQEIREQCRQEKRFLCIPGSEVSGRVHLLAIGIHEEINPAWPVKKQVEEIHAQGGLAIAAHPFEARWRYSDAELFQSGLDGMECMYIPPTDLAHFQEMQKKYPLRCVYNSDAHSYLDMNTYTICVGKMETLDDIRDAYRENRCFQ